MNDMQWRAAHAAELAANRRAAKQLLDETTGMTHRIFKESLRDTQFHSSSADSLAHITLKPIADNKSIIGHYYKDGAIKAAGGHSVNWLLK